MKPKFILILIAIFFISIAAVSAANNATGDDTQIVDSINVSYTQQVYKDDLGTVDVEIPENTSGNLKAEVDGVEIYSQNVTGSVEIPISIPEPKYPIIVPNRITDCSYHSIYLFFNDVELKMNHTLQVMNYKPDWEIHGFTSEILQNDDKAYSIFMLPASVKGIMEIYIDGNLSEKMNATQYLILNITKFNTLPLGNHTVRFNYSGDNYYRPFDKTFNFSVVDMKISIPTNMVLDHDDCITAKTLKNRDGTLTIYVDSKKVFADKLEKNGEFLHSMFSDVTCGEHEIEVVYNAKNFTKSKKAIVNVSYYIDLFPSYDYVYGSENTINIIFPADVNKKLINITINGVKQDFKIDNQGWVDVDISKLPAGNYTVEVSYLGDLKYNPTAVSDNFTVIYSILAPYMVDIGYGNEITLNLPSTAKGSLDVYINGKLYKSAKSKNGEYKIKLNDLTPGEYNLSVNYTGDDYAVKSVENPIDVFPDLYCPNEMYVGQDKSITLTSQKGDNGTASFNIGGKIYNVSFKNGKASLNLKNIKVGSYDDIVVTYIGDNGNMTLYAFLDVYSTKISLTNINVLSGKLKAKVLINDKVAKNTYVTFKVDKKTLKVKTDKNGFATLTLNPGKHTVTAIFKDAKTSKTLTGYKLSLKTVKVKKSAKKLVLTATVKKLANKKVTFKFNGKKYTAKTNKNGIAKVTVKKSVLSKLKVGKKVSYQVTYLKSTVKKSVKVKN